MLQFKTIIKRFGQQGEKTGWSYLEITPEQASDLNPGVRTTYRVKGKLDHHVVEKMAIMPMGNGSFVLPLNATIRKSIKKGVGDELRVTLEVDKDPIKIDQDFIECLQDDEAAFAHFQKLTKGHQNYFSKWIESAKTEPTKAKRIAMAITALSNGWGFPEMLRANKKEKEQLGFK